MDIADWLRGLGREKYASAFDENAINWDVLSELTTDDLREIGVAAVGDRRRLLAAIAALCEGALPAAPKSQVRYFRQLLGSGEVRRGGGVDEQARVQPS